MKKQLVAPVMLLAGVGRRGTHHIQTPGGWGGGINSSVLSLLIKQQLNSGCVSKWVLPPQPHRKRDFNTQRTSTSRLTLFHLTSIAGKVRSRPQVLLWQKPWRRTEGFYSNCVQRKIQIDNTAALFTHSFEMLVMKGLSLTPSHLPHKNWSLFYVS